jgi:hypothetical protein
MLGTAENASENLDLATRVERVENELAAMKRLLKRLRHDAGAETDVA